MTFYLQQHFLFRPMTEELVSSCQEYVCSKDYRINKFFHEEYLDYAHQLLGKSYCFVSKTEPKIAAAFTVANSSVRVDDMPKSKRNKLNRKIPFSKQRSQYPAVLVAQLTVFDEFAGHNLGKDVLDMVKAWFIDPLNKTGCRYVVVDAVNTPKVLQFYKDNGFDFIFSSDEEEMQYMSKAVNVQDGSVFRETRLMIFDLIQLKAR